MLAFAEVGVFKERFERSRIAFPSTCVRCGNSEAPRLRQLIIPYQKWWRSNPVVKAPVCTTCSISLSLQSWASLALVIGACFLASTYLSIWVIMLVFGIYKHYSHSVPAWADSPSVAEILVLVVFLAAFFFFAALRDRFLRRDHLRVKVTDYGNDWIELSSSDIQYFAELTKLSEAFSD